MKKIKKCLVTGSKGFIGSHLTNYLKNRGHYVRGVDIKDQSFLETKEDEFLQLDLRKIRNAMKATENIDWVFHLSADMGGLGWIMGDKDGQIMRNNAIININVLEACKKDKLDQIFFSSSACVYPKFLQTSPKVKGLKESDVIPAHPDSAYGWCKLWSEILFKSYEKDYGLDVRIARFHNIYGPFTTYTGGQEKAPASICRKVAEAEDGSSIVVWGDGKQTRSFTYISDCVEAIYLLMQSNFSDPINIGTDDLISIDDLAKLVMKNAGKKLTLKHDLSKPQGVRGRNCDLTLVQKVLGWKPQVKLEDGMGRLYKWVEQQVEGDSASP